MKKVLLSIVACLTITIVVENVCADLNEGLVAKYFFNGNAIDETQNGKNGTVNGSSLTDDRFGNADSAYFFDGIDDYIGLPVSTLNNWDQLTFSIWIKAPEYNGTYWPAFIGGDTGVPGGDPHNISIGIHRSDARLWVEITTDKGNYSLNAINTIPWDSWFHAVMVYDGSTLKEYINGTLGGERNASGTLKTITSLNIGKCLDYYESFSYFKGKIDDIRIYNRALSEAEIQLLYSEKEDSCDYIDSDNDGVPDEMDICPNSHGLYTDKNGCVPDGFFITNEQASKLVQNMKSIITIVDEIGIEDAIQALKISAGMNK